MSQDNELGICDGDVRENFPCPSNKPHKKTNCCLNWRSVSPAAVRPATPEVKAQQVVTVAGVSLSVDRYNELLAKSGIYCPYDGKLLTFNGYPTVIQDSPHTTICWGLTCSGCTSTFMLVPHWDAVNKRRMVDPESIKFVAALAVPDAAARLAEKIIDTYKQSTFDNSVENVAALIREAQGEMPAEPSVQPAGSAQTERESFETWARYEGIVVEHNPKVPLDYLRFEAHCAWKAWLTRASAAPANLDSVVAQASKDLCRELYDRFMMGGWEPQDAWAEAAAIIRKAVEEVANAPRT